QGDLPAALTAYHEARAIREMLAARDRANTEWQQDLAVSHDRIGEVLVAQGDLPAALTAYHKALAIREMLAARDPDNAQWLTDVAVSCAKLSALRDDKSVTARQDYLVRGRDILLKLKSDGHLLQNEDLIGWFNEELAKLIQGRS
ncbi:MAG: tetratricopeptide repeat protein, partial [Nitrospira sp.]|nr:tetratricopeptide repeat protein [Nitrospira sp.]